MGHASPWTGVGGNASAELAVRRAVSGAGGAVFRKPYRNVRNMGEFPSGQRGQTVNLLAMPSVVRIHPLPPFYHNQDIGGIEKCP